MRLGWFFPSAALLVAAIIWVALAPGLRNQRALEVELERVRAQGYVVDALGLQGFRATGGTTHEIIESGALTRARLKSLRAAPGGPREGAGVFVTLPGWAGHLFDGRRVRVTITARRAPEDGALEFGAAYFIARTGASGWRTFQPTTRFADYSFEWTPPSDNGGNASLIGVAPDSSGGLGSIEVLRIRVELADEADRVSAQAP